MADREPITFDLSDDHIEALEKLAAARKVRLTGEVRDGRFVVDAVSFAGDEFSRPLFVPVTSLIAAINAFVHTLVAARQFDMRLLRVIVPVPPSGSGHVTTLKTLWRFVPPALTTILRVKISVVSDVPENAHCPVALDNPELVVATIM